MSCDTHAGLRLPRDFGSGSSTQRSPSSLGVRSPSLTNSACSSASWSGSVELCPCARLTLIGCVPRGSPSLRCGVCQPRRFPLVLGLPGASRPARSSSATVISSLQAPAPRSDSSPLWIRPICASEAVIPEVVTRGVGHPVFACVPRFGLLRFPCVGPLSFQSRAWGLAHRPFAASVSVVPGCRPLSVL